MVLGRGRREEWGGEDGRGGGRGRGKRGEKRGAGGLCAGDQREAGLGKGREKRGEGEGSREKAGAGNHGRRWK